VTRGCCWRRRCGNHGYHAERGTTIYAEHGTAAVRDNVAQLLHDHSGGKITVRRSGITGREQALAGLYNGDGKGNFRFKAPLESLHNLIQNEQAFWPGQTGPDFDRRPEHLAGLLTRNSALMQAACNMPAERAKKLIRPLLEWSQMERANHEVIRRINGRVDHELEGWLECGHTVVEFRLDEHSDCWLQRADFARLPAKTREIIGSLIEDGAPGYTRARKLSPGEVLHHGSPALTKASPALVAAILGEDLARDIKTDGAYFEFEDADVGAGAHVFEAVIVSADGHRREARRGEVYKGFVNPFAPDDLLLFDAAMRQVGICRRINRASHADVAAVQQQWAANARREKEIYAEQKIRKNGWAAAQAAEREHNNDIIGGTTPADRAAARAERTLSRRAEAATAAAGKNKQQENRDDSSDEY
jgi:hypothetical protein